MLFGELNETSVDKVMKSTTWRRLIEQVLHKLNQNSIKGSKRNIAAHYDLGNEFYQLWLDRTMTYSSALFEGDTVSLSEAQRQKYLRIAKKIELKNGDKLLEIGCGWGGFAEIAAKEYGCQVTALTLSKEQASSCKKRAINTGIEKNVDIRLEDYRDVKGLYDKIVSIEMLEAVGEKFWKDILKVYVIASHLVARLQFRQLQSRMIVSKATKKPRLHSTIYFPRRHVANSIGN